MLSPVGDHILQEFNTLYLTRFRTYNISRPPQIYCTPAAGQFFQMTKFCVVVFTVHQSMLCTNKYKETQIQCAAQFIYYLHLNTMRLHQQQHPACYLLLIAKLYGGGRSSSMRTNNSLPRRGNCRTASANGGGGASSAASLLLLSDFFGFKLIQMARMHRASRRQRRRKKITKEVAQTKRIRDSRGI